MRLHIGTYYLLCLILSLMQAASTRAVTPVDFGQNFQAYGQDVFVQYRAWIPEGFDRLKGLILTFPGSRGDQRGITGNTLWQFRLEQMGYGIVGFRDLLDYGYDYWGGSVEEAHANFQMVLDSVAQTFGHPEISNAPVVLDGVSQGGFVVGYLGSLIPERTLGFIADKGYNYATLDDSRYAAPGLIIAGERDDVVVPEYLNQAFRFSRELNANNAYLVEWRTTHRETTENLRLVAMDQFMRSRYPAGELPSLESNTPLVLDQPTGWLAESSVYEFGVGQIFNPDPVITPAVDYPLDPSIASWLPNETLARIYQAHNENTRNGARVQFDMPNLFVTQVAINLKLSGITAQEVELFHEDELIATLNPAIEPLKFNYQPLENGLHTFLAVAHYMDGGVAKSSTNYFAAVVTGVATVPEPHTAFLLLGSAVWFAGFNLVRRRQPLTKPISGTCSDDCVD